MLQGVGQSPSLPQHMCLHLGVGQGPLKRAAPCAKKKNRISGPADLFDAVPTVRSSARGEALASLQRQKQEQYNRPHVLDRTVPMHVQHRCQRALDLTTQCSQHL